MPFGTAYSSLFISFYAAAVKKWILDGKIPSVIPAMILTFFGEIVHFSIFYILGSCMNHEATALAFLSEAY